MFLGCPCETLDLQPPALHSPPASPVTSTFLQGGKGPTSLHIFASSLQRSTHWFVRHWNMSQGSFSGYAPVVPT